MRRGRFLLAAVVAALLSAVAVGAATAQSSTCPPGQSLTSDGYCSPVTTPGTTSGITTGTTTGEVLGTTTSSSGGGGGGGGVAPGGSAPTSGTQGAQHTLGSPLHAARQSGTLPFTGAQLTIFALVGIALIVGGYLLHTTGRRRGSDA